MPSFPFKLIPAIRCLCGYGNMAHEVIKGDHGGVMDGMLICSQCSMTYFIKEGILELLPLQKKAGINQESITEMGRRDEQAFHYDSHLADRVSREIPSTLKAFGDTAHKKIIEYGCGTGRFTLHMKKAASVLAVDISRESLMFLAAKLKQVGQSNVGLVWADVITLPIADAFFDKALSAQVYEHIPTRLERLKFLYGVKRSLNKNSIFVLSAYHYDMRRRINKKPREGHHGSGIFFHYFSKREMVGEVNTVFPQVQAGYTDITFPLATRIAAAIQSDGILSRICEWIPGIRQFAHLLLIKTIHDGIAGAVHSRQFIFRKKYWYWFVPPIDVPYAAMASFFSYEERDMPGFQKGAGQTSMIDLSPNLSDIWDGMREKFVRSQIEKGVRNGIEVREGREMFKEFARLYKIFRAQRSLAVDRLATFAGCSFLITAFYKGRLVAGGLFISDGFYVRAYALASARMEAERGSEREIIGQANRIVIWEAIKFAHSTRHHFFDLGGINPNSPNEQLTRLAEFKEAFGGKRKNNYYYHKTYSPLLRMWMRARGLKP